MIDGVDRTILMMLQANGRVSNAEIARQVAARVSVINFAASNVVPISVIE